MIMKSAEIPTDQVRARTKQYSPIFKAEQFQATEWSTAEDKAKFLNDLAAFVNGGYSRAKFTKALYTRLSMCFGHIAHYNANGFYSRWFADPADRAYWKQHILHKTIYGDPTYTFSDAEKAFQEWLKKNG